MDFRYSPRQAALKQSAAELYEFIKQYELDNEVNNGLPSTSHEDVKKAVLAAGLQAVNMPAEWGGAGLTIFEQVVVQEELGRLTGALWDMVWRPANALRQRIWRRRLRPSPRGRLPPWLPPTSRAS